ncbi:MAG TPA: DUF916 domain-containing protein, partial [Acidimicrobiia bacterium]|nr:DUF916 domain-containing protein [Acidimicrobiia bacterium]
MRARRAVVFVAAAFIASAGLTAPAGAGKFGDVVAATMPPGSQASPGHFYLLNAGAGATITQKIRVSNPNDHAVTVVVEPVDATTGDETGVQLGRPGSAKALISRWIVVSSPQVTLAPNEGRDIPFTVQVPTGTKPGQYLAGVSASVPLSASAPQTPPPGQAGFSVDIRFQRAIAVEIDVPGPRAPQLKVNEAEPLATPGGVELGVHIANTGNAFARGSGV